MTSVRCHVLASPARQIPREHLNGPVNNVNSYYCNGADRCKKRNLEITDLTAEKK